MKLSHLFFIISICATCLLSSLKSYSQNRFDGAKASKEKKDQKEYPFNPNTPIIQRVEPTPPSVIKMFQDAGMSPIEHHLTDEEKQIINQAINVLPPLHLSILKKHLKSISFLNNMPNTALTSLITKKNDTKLYHIAFRAGVLQQNISEWITEKENTYFIEVDSTISIAVEAGLMNALTYILLHEATHVVDGSLDLLSNNNYVIASDHVNNSFSNEFTSGIWNNLNTLTYPIKDSTYVKSYFRQHGRRFKTSEALQVYNGLCSSPFASLYSTASWHEDLAELVTINHLTTVLNQPFYIVVKRNNKEILRYEPLKNKKVKNRTDILNFFYKGN